MTESWLSPLARNVDDSCDSSEEDVPAQVAMKDPLTKDIWAEQNFDALVELYSTFCKTGDALFGRAFYQFGTHEHFIQFVYKHSVQLGK